jgi:hypothetical protein
MSATDRAVGGSGLKTGDPSRARGAFDERNEGSGDHLLVSVLKIGLICDSCDRLFDRKPGEKTYVLRMRARDKHNWSVNNLQESCDPKESDYLRPRQRVDTCGKCVNKKIREAIRKLNGREEAELEKLRKRMI